MTVATKTPATEYQAELRAYVESMLELKAAQERALARAGDLTGALERGDGRHAYLFALEAEGQRDDLEGLDIAGLVAGAQELERLAAK